MCAAAVNAQQDPKVPFLTRSLAVASIKDVQIETTGGNISVTATTGGDARLEVYVHSNNKARTLSNEEIRKQLEEDYSFHIDINNKKLTAVARSKSNGMDWKNSLSISFKAYVPANTSTDLTTSGGNIDLSNISGKQEFVTSGGNLIVDNVGGKIKGTTSGGNINLANSRDEIELTTSGGNIHADHCTGTMNLTTSGGSVKLSQLKGDIDASTSGGNISGSGIEGKLSAATSGGNVSLTDLACSLSAATSGGNINVEIKTLGSYIKLGNSAGNINLTLPGNKGIDLDLRADRIETSTLQNFSGRKDKDAVRGTLNGGGITVQADADGGNINLVIK